MRFTNNDLVKAMGLEIGDRVRVKCADGSSSIYKLNPDYSLSFNRVHIHLVDIIELDYEILPKKKASKKVGDLLCSNSDCVNCPLRVINCKGFGNNTLYEKLKKSVEGSDNELYDILKARLDKEIE